MLKNWLELHVRVNIFRSTVRYTKPEHNEKEIGCGYIIRENKLNLVRHIVVTVEKYFFLV